MELEEMMVQVRAYEASLKDQEETGEYDDRGNWKWGKSLRADFELNFPAVTLPKCLQNAEYTMKDYVKDRFEALPMLEDAFKVMMRSWDLDQFMYEVDQMESEDFSIVEVAFWRAVKDILLKMDMSKEKQFLIDLHQQYLRDGVYDSYENSSTMEEYEEYLKQKKEGSIAVEPSK